LEGTEAYRTVVFKHFLVWASAMSSLKFLHQLYKFPTQPLGNLGGLGGDGVLLYDLIFSKCVIFEGLSSLPRIHMTGEDIM
jgi:hypothetical protein